MIRLCLLVPFTLMIVRQIRPKYIFSPMITLSCMVIAALSGQEARAFVCLALVFSVIGDFFLENKSISKNSYLYGISGFFLAHTCFMTYALIRSEWSVLSLFVAFPLLAGYGVFVVKKLYPALDSNAMRIAVTLYMLISIAAFSSAFSIKDEIWSKCAFILGIFSILFSDTIIAFSDFLSRKKMDFLLMPTYFLCHILVAASMNL